MINTIDTKYGKIEYSWEGHGTTILIIHGGHSNAKESLAKKSIDLNSFSILIPSRPGYGGTPLTGHKTPYDIALLLMELVKALNIDTLILYGISAGGPTTIEIAAHFPEKVKCMILTSAVTTNWLPKGSLKYRMAKIMFHPTMESRTWRVTKKMFNLFPSLMAKIFLSQFSTHSPEGISKTEIEELQHALNNYSAGSGFYHDLDHGINQNTFPKVKVPTYIFHSKNDNSVSVSHAIYAHHQIDHSTLHLFSNGWGHMLWLGNDSDKFTEAITLILNDVKRQ